VSRGRDLNSSSRSRAILWSIILDDARGRLLALGLRAQDEITTYEQNLDRMESTMIQWLMLLQKNRASRTRIVALKKQILQAAFDCK